MPKAARQKVVNFLGNTAEARKKRIEFIYKSLVNLMPNDNLGVYKRDFEITMAAQLGFTREKIKDYLMMLAAQGRIVISRGFIKTTAPEKDT